MWVFPFICNSCPCRPDVDLSFYAHTRSSCLLKGRPNNPILIHTKDVAWPLRLLWATWLLRRKIHRDLLWSAHCHGSFVNRSILNCSATRVQQSTSWIVNYSHNDCYYLIPVIAWKPLEYYPHAHNMQSQTCVRLVIAITIALVSHTYVIDWIAQISPKLRECGRTNMRTRLSILFFFTAAILLAGQSQIDGLTKPPLK